MANIEDQLKNVRTLEDIVNILSILFNNMNTISGIYYDLFLNKEPMLVTVNLYNENGVLEERQIPNVAYYKSSVLLNAGDPNGSMTGSVGNFCIDTLTNNLYYKAEGTNSDSGWKRVYSSNTDEFLTPWGSAAQLTNLNMDSATAGVLSVLRGGTGLGSRSNPLFTGLVKANNDSAFSQAEANTDYVHPASMIGVVSYFAGPVDIKEDEATEVNGGWLVCNGKAVSKTGKYANLYQVLKGSGGSSRYGETAGTFNLPDLMNMYIKGSDVVANSGDAAVGQHTHTVSGATSTNSHSHGPGTYDITGVAGTSWMSSSKLKNIKNQITGCFFKITSGWAPVIQKSADGKTFTFKKENERPVLENNKAVYYGVNDASTSPNDPGMGFQASLNWSGRTEEQEHSHQIMGNSVSTTYKQGDEEKEAPEENEVKHLTMIPIIKF